MRSMQFVFVQARLRISLLLLLGLLLGSRFAPLPGSPGYRTGAGAYGCTLTCVTCNGPAAAPANAPCRP